MAEIERQIVKVESAIKRQTKVTQTFEGIGRDTSIAKRTLADLEKSLARWQERLAKLRAEPTEGA